jgi:hypothetical protein
VQPRLDGVLLGAAKPNPQSTGLPINADADKVA